MKGKINHLKIGKIYYIVTFLLNFFKRCCNTNEVVKLINKYLVIF